MCVYVYACVCTIIIQWQILQLEYSRIQNLAWHANIPDTRLPCTERKKGWIEQGKMAEVKHKTCETAPWNGFKVVLTWERPGGSSWQFPVCLFVCLSGRRRKRERKRTYVHIEVGLAGRPSMIQPHLSSPIRPLWPHTHTHMQVAGFSLLERIHMPVYYAGVGWAASGPSGK